MHACVVAPAYNHHKHKGPPTSIIYPPLHPAQPPSSIIGKPTHSLTHLPSNPSIHGLDEQLNCMFCCHPDLQVIG